MITSITDYHRPNQREYDLQECNGCNLTFDSKDVRRSVITGEILCLVGVSCCWDIASVEHEMQNTLWGFAKSKFE